jgi:hypothetical protein
MHDDVSQKKTNQGVGGYKPAIPNIGVSLNFSPGRYTCGIIGLIPRPIPKKPVNRNKPKMMAASTTQRAHTRFLGFSLTILNPP